MRRDRRRHGRSKLMSETNMTPLIDLTFLLLIAFIITTPMLEQGISIKLPRGQAEKLDQSKAQSVTIDVTGEVYLNNKLISPMELEEAMLEIAKQDPAPPVLVRCDERVDYGELMKTLRILNKCKVARMALVTEPAQ